MYWFFQYSVTYCCFDNSIPCIARVFSILANRRKMVSLIWYNTQFCIDWLYNFFRGWALLEAINNMYLYFKLLGNAMPLRFDLFSFVNENVLNSSIRLHSSVTSEQSMVWFVALGSVDDAKNTLLLASSISYACISKHRHMDEHEQLLCWADAKCDSIHLNA